MTSEQPTAAEDPTTQLRRLATQWAAAADRAFAAGLTDPAAYARTTRLVSAVVQTLRERGDGADALIAAWHERHDLTIGVAATDEILTTDGLVVDDVAGAAFAMRHREVAAAIAQERRLAALAEHAGRTAWAVLEESGPFGGDPFVPYRRLEVNADRGEAVLVTTRPNDDFTEPVHIVEALHFDPATGALRPLVGDDSTMGPREFHSTEGRESHVAAVRGDPGDAP